MVPELLGVLTLTASHIAAILHEALRTRAAEPVLVYSVALGLCLIGTLLLPVIPKRSPRQETPAHPVVRVRAAQAKLLGDGAYAFRVHALNRFQPALRRLTQAHEELRCEAVLFPELGNPQDMSVSIRIAGRKVGYLPPVLASRYCEVMNQNGFASTRIKCQALIHREVSARRSSDKLAIKLDMMWPVQLAIE